MYAAQYNLVRACLLILCMEARLSAIQMIAPLGYKITGYQVGAINSEAYSQSIQNAFARANNLLTKMKTKQNQMKEYTKDGDGGGATFSRAVANISTAIGFPVGEDVTLAMFNEYKNIAKKKHANNK